MSPEQPVVSKTDVCSIFMDSLIKLREAGTMSVNKQVHNLNRCSEENEQGSGLENNKAEGRGLLGWAGRILLRR